jgi:hypothetical protein
MSRLEKSGKGSSTDDNGDCLVFRYEFEEENQDDGHVHNGS